MLFAVAKQCAHEAQNVGHDRDSAVPAEDAGSIQAATEAEEDGPHQEIPGRTLHKWRGVSVVLVSHLPQRRHTQDQLTHGSMRTAMARYATRIRRVKRWLVRW